MCETIDAYPTVPSSNLAVQYYAIPGKYFLIGWCPAGGMTLKWFRDNFYNGEGADYDSMTASAASVLWNQIKADITGKRITTMKCSENASVGGGRSDSRVCRALRKGLSEIYPD